MGPDPYDIVVVGGGPVGLHAALKAAVLNHEVLLVDKGTRYSRACQAAAIANIPGAPGVTGAQLLERGRQAIHDFEALAGKRLVTWRECFEAVAARRENGLFALRLRGEDGCEEEIRCRVLVLATGVVDRKPGIEVFSERGHETLAPWVHRDEIGYCLLCEGWSLEGKDIAVIGSDPDAAEIAVDVADHFQARVELLTDGAPLEEDAASRLADARVPVEPRPLARIGHDDGRLRIELEDGTRLAFDKALLGLGWYKVNNELAVQLGARTTRDGYVVTDPSCEVLDADGRRIPGLFAVGDLRAGRWKQIVIGWGDAETAIISAYATRLPSAKENGRT